MLITILNVNENLRIAGGIEASMYSPYYRQNARIFVRFLDDGSVPERGKTYSITSYHEWTIRNKKSLLLHGKIDSSLAIDDARSYNLSRKN